MTNNHFDPLPESLGEFPKRRGKFIDIETFGLRATNAFIVSGTLADLTVNGNLTMGSDGVLRTASSGQRIELTNTFQNEISFYSGDASELYNSRIKHDVVGVGTARFIQTSIVSGSLVKTSATNDSNITLSSTSQDDSTSDSKISISTRAAGVVTSVERLRITGTYAWFTLPIYAQDGAVNAPALTFNSDTDSGWYLNATGDIAAATGGTKRLGINSTRVRAQNVSFLGMPVKSTTGDPASPQNGDMYVNTLDNKVRVYADAAWRDLVTW